MSSGQAWWAEQEAEAEERLHKQQQEMLKDLLQSLTPLQLGLLREHFREDFIKQYAKSKEEAARKELEKILR